MTTANGHRTNIYVGLAGESALVVGVEGTPRVKVDCSALPRANRSG